MSKSKATPASSKAANTVATKSLEFIPDYDELKEMAGDSCIETNNKKSLELVMAMCNPKYFDYLNDCLNTAVRAAGVNERDLNFAKLYCIQNLAYPANCFLEKENIQKTLTRDILTMNESGNALNEMLTHFSCFCDLIDPEETDMLNVSDERLKEFMTA